MVDWETPLGHCSKLALDPKLVENLRKYLLGTDPFPTDVLILAIALPDGVGISANARRSSHPCGHGNPSSEGNNFAKVSSEPGTRPDM